MCRAENLRTASGEIFIPPLFWWSWRLVVVDDSNDSGGWMTFRPERGPTILELDPSRELLRQARRL